MNKVFLFLVCVMPLAVGFSQTTLKAETNRRGFQLRENVLDFGTYHALIIAVQKYDDNQWTNPGPTIDIARRLKQVLSERYMFNSSNITFLQDPTRQEILGEFETLRQTLTEGDNLLLVYVGLGSYLEQIDQGYWIPRDASYEQRATWITNLTIQEYCDKLSSKHVLLISDARISGNDALASGGSLPPDSSLMQMTGRRSRRAISGNTMRDILVNKDFLQTFIQVLEKNQKKHLSGAQIALDLSILKSISGQTPVYGVIRGSGDDGGEFVFVRR